MLEKEFCVRFVTSSPHAAPMEMMSAMQDSIGKAAKSGTFAWDCKDNEEVMLVLYGLFLGDDNPMHTEECSHAGLHCNYFCRTCEVGGTKEYKESDEGYSSIFVPGKLCTPAGTAAEIRTQFVTVLQSGASKKFKKSVASTGVKDTTTTYILDAVVEMGKKLHKWVAGIQPKHDSEVRTISNKELEDLLQGSTLDDAINPLLGVKGFNVHQDMPTEILHMVLLGVVKYFWGQTVYLLEKDGLNSPHLNADYICHYKGSLIGKHFKSLAQVMPFLIQDLLPRTVLNGWTIIGELVVHIWHTEIDDMEIYLTIEDVLNVTAQCTPSILISKPKFHLLVHLPAYIRHFGPAILFSTEQYKSFNHIFQLACIYRNQQGPSQDMCRIFARQDIIKHIAMGGYWFDTASKKAGVAFGNSYGNISCNSQLKKVAAVDGQFVPDKPVPWTATRCAKALNIPQPATIRYRHGISLVVSNGKKASLGGHIIFHDSSTSSSEIRCVHEILISNSCRCVQHVAVQKFTFGPALHPLLHLPTLELTDHDIVISPESLCETPLRVPNVADVCLAAARQIREKKAAKKAGETPGATSVSAPPDDVARVPAVFDRPAAKAASKAKPTRKAKEKVPRPRANARHPTIIQSAASSSHQLSTPLMTPVASGSSYVPSPPAPTPSMHPPTIVPSQWQQSLIPSSRVPPSHHLLHPLPMMLTWQYHHPPPTHTGQLFAPVMTPHVWNPQADPLHHDQFRR
ncbi:hypothetical protein EV424DRAFT_1541383 [Suillus variegatus]|nr:hypothetical protein EV424DRAFT_1541383 [Suillus variegatus]